MQLSALISDSAAREPLLGWHSSGRAETEVTGLCLDSRLVQPGDLFFCLPGDNTDGHVFGPEAVAMGAGGLVVDHWLELDIAQVMVTSVRRAMAWMSASFWGDPTAELDVVGVTGTNGKTTTAHLVKSILDNAGRSCGLLGTLTGERTTPEAPDLQKSLRAMVDEGLRSVAMEVSSHALAQDRVLGMTFDVGVFTNLTPDHLDYHGSFEDYFEAKASLFRTGSVKASVVNDDDEFGRRLLSELDQPTSSYSRGLARDPQLGIEGSTFTWRDQPVDLALPGLFNMENAVAAAEAVRMLADAPADHLIAAGLSVAERVPGRFEVVIADSCQGPRVIVDYSHTPAGIEQVLSSVREIAPDATLCLVFGAAGDRDAEKRPLMGAAAAANADHLIVTSDNPRSEDPDAIIADVLAGVTNAVSIDVQPDRRRAIAAALESHGAGDIVVIAGKGHETTQTVGDDVLRFDDREVVRELTTQGDDR